MQSEERRVIRFEGTDSAYADFRDCLDDCELNEDVRVKRVKHEKPITVEEVVRSEKTAASDEAAMGSRPSLPVAEKVPEEQEMKRPDRTCRIHKRTTPKMQYSMQLVMQQLWQVVYWRVLPDWLQRQRSLEEKH